MKLFFVFQLIIKALNDIQRFIMAFEIKDKDAFDKLCTAYTNAESESAKKQLCLKYRDKVGCGLNEHGVFVNANEIEIIAHKAVDISLRYIKTPHGFLATTSYNFKSGCMSGSSSPITVFCASKGNYIQNLRDFVIGEVERILNSKTSRDDNVVTTPLKKYLKQTEQMSLFDDPEAPLVLS